MNILIPLGGYYYYVETIKRGLVKLALLTEGIYVIWSSSHFIIAATKLNCESEHYTATLNIFMYVHVCVHVYT